MRARYMLDTDICIHVRRRRSPGLLARFVKLMPGEAVLSVITWGELLFGAERSARRKEALDQLDELFSLIEVMPLSCDVAAAYGAIRAALATRGELMGPNDLWIAAHAQTAGLTLVTSNVREFRRIRGLSVENWAA
jgi:tRNA(fMet)-specific endonuclease VapC